MIKIIKPLLKKNGTSLMKRNHPGTIDEMVRTGKVI